MPRAEHLDDAEAGADGDGAAEELLHLLGPGVGGDVVVLGRQAEQLVAHAAAGPERLIAGLPEPLDDVDGELTLGHVPRSSVAGSPGVGNSQSPPLALAFCDTDSQ